MKQMDIKKAFAILHALKDNLPLSGSISEKYVRIYHGEIDRLSDLGFKDLDDFKIFDKEIKHQLTSFVPAISGIKQQETKNYSDDKYIEREFFLTKIDSLLMFFQVSSPEIEIGFKAD